MVTAAVRTVQPRSSCRELASATASVLSSRSFGVVGLALFCAESNNGCLTPIPRAPRDLVPFLLPLPATYSALGRIYLKLVISEGLNSGIFHFSGGRTWQKPGLTCVTRSIGKNAPEHVERECRKCTAPRLPSAKGSHRDAQCSVWSARVHTCFGGGYRVAAYGASTGCLALVAPFDLAVASLTRVVFGPTFLRYYAYVGRVECRVPPPFAGTHATRSLVAADCLDGCVRAEPPSVARGSPVFHKRTYVHNWVVVFPCTASSNFRPNGGDVRKAALGRRILGGDRGPPVSPVGAGRAYPGSPRKRGRSIRYGAASTLQAQS